MRGNLEEDFAAIETGLRDCEQRINNNYDVRGLCASMPERLEKLKASKGDRLKF